MTGGRKPVPAAALAELEDLYAALDAELEGLAFTCRIDGACCRFEESGLSLFATFIEAYYLLHGGRGAGGPGEDGVPEGSGDCPFLEENACCRRSRRTLGCRIYSCDPSTSESRSKIYEKYHHEIQRLHGRYDLPYEYRELREWVHRAPLC